MSQGEYEREIRRVSVEIYGELFLDESRAMAAGIPPSAIIRAMNNGVICSDYMLVDA